MPMFGPGNVLTRAVGIRMSSNRKAATALKPKTLPTIDDMMLTTLFSSKRSIG